MLKSVILFFVLPLLFNSCKRDIAGCTDVEATNWSQSANLNDGSCKYPPFIVNPDFELGDRGWSTYSGNGYSWYVTYSDASDGFMPTHGQWFLKCIPDVNKTNGTATKQYFNVNKHCKGIYFDYSYYGVASSKDSVLSAFAGVSYFPSMYPSVYWSKTIFETPKSYGSFPNVIVQKRNEYMDLTLAEKGGLITITSSVSKGTFTFQVDNIREVPR